MMCRKVLTVLIALGTVVAVHAEGNSEKLIQTKYSKKAVRLVMKYRGKRVGSGTSLALLQLYEKKSRAKNGLKFSLSKKTLPYIAVGDELVFSGTYKNTNVKNTLESTSVYVGPMHYAIVVGKKDDNTLIIAHQNLKEDNPKKTSLVLSEIKADDSTRFENINVYGLWPKRKNKNPEKILVKDGPVYEINSVYNEKTGYLAVQDFVR